MTSEEQSCSIRYAIFLLVRLLFSFWDFMWRSFFHFFELMAGNHAAIEIRGHVLCFWHALDTGATLSAQRVKSVGKANSLGDITNLHSHTCYCLLLNIGPSSEMTVMADLTWSFFTFAYITELFCQIIKLCFHISKLICGLPHKHL